MATFFISAATSIKFKILTSAGTINESAFLDGNFLHNEASTFNNLSTLSTEDCPQKYNCDDTVKVQFVMSQALTEPVVEVVDSSGNVDGYPTLSNTSGDVWEFEIDWSGYTCGDVYQIKIYSLLFGLNTLACGDSGTFETGVAGSWGVSTGGSNVIGKVSTPTAHGGTYSASIATPGSTTSAETDLLWCTSAFSLSADSVYVFEAYVQDNGTSPAIANNRQIQVDISDFSDATTFSHQQVTPSDDGRNQWHLLRIIFQTGSDTSGTIKISTNANPQSSGFMYVDDMSLKPTTFVQEGVSEKISICTSWPDTSLLTWTSTVDHHGIEYVNSEIVHTVRDQFHALRFSMIDELQEDRDNSIGQGFLHFSQKVKTYDFVTGILPAYMLEKVALALTHETVKLNGMQIVLVGEIVIEWNPTQLMGTLKAPVRPKTYNYNFSEA